MCTAFKTFVLHIPIDLQYNINQDSECILCSKHAIFETHVYNIFQSHFVH